MSKVGDILDSKPQVIWSLRSDQSVLDALRLMSEKGIGAILVIDDGKLVGILSERDYARKVVLDSRSSSSTLIGDIMTHQVMCVDRSDSINECMSIMTQRDFRHLPVVKGDEVLGMVSVGDLLKRIINEQQSTIEHLEQYISG